MSDERYLSVAKVNEQPKADWPEGTIKAYENYRNDPESIEHRASSGKRRKTRAGRPVKVRPFCASKQQKSPQFH
jgi:hypothetical protein